ncbi:HNH endonuclease [Polyangium sp. 15x6]|uniref:HNH endonuclease n=1 Tax=Polyangium sp. 15x6 TaxID=3042687 RepID=UPI00249CECAF|nr:HNH endonuclease [Polyangium sp. 15x6]MDI3290141.1 HNH endonuclease [Polyangium sp. 15x6]
MKCIICLADNPPKKLSKEHIFPEAVGGTLTTNRVCKPCNDVLGQVADAPLTNHPLIGLVRNRLGLSGKGGYLPNPLERGTLHDDPDVKVRIEQRSGGKPYIYTIPSIKKVDNGEGAELHFCVDARDANRLGDIINKSLAREGAPPLNEDEIARIASRVTCTENPTINVPLSLDVTHYRRGILKIVYELAHLWLGDRYLDDPAAPDIRNCMRDAHMPYEIARKYAIRGQISFGSEHWSLPFWKNEPDSLIGVGLASQNAVSVYVRILGVFDAMIPVTEHRSDYPHFTNQFILIDAATGRRRASTFADEVKRMAHSG